MDWAPEIKVEFTPTDIKSEPDFITTGDNDECDQQDSEDVIGVGEFKIQGKAVTEDIPVNYSSSDMSDEEVTPTNIKTEPDFITTYDINESDQPKPEDLIGVGEFKIEVKLEADDNSENDGSSDVSDESAIPIGDNTMTVNDAAHTHKIQVVKRKKQQDNEAVGRRWNYSKETLLAAVGAVKQNELNLSQAARMYKIPFTTLWDRVNCKGLGYKADSSKTNVSSNVPNEKKIIQKIKATRHIWTGWTHEGCRMYYKGAGSKSIVVPTEFTYEQLLQSVCDVYFPNGENPDRQLQLKDLDAHMATLTDEDLVPDKGRSFTVHELWQWKSYSVIQIWLHTKLKLGRLFYDGPTLNTYVSSYVPNEKKIPIQKTKAKTHTMKRKTKATRQVWTGWKHGGMKMSFNGEGSKAIVVSKEFTYEQLIQSVCDVYFPNGENPDRQLQLKDLEAHLATLNGRDLVPEKGRSFTVYEFWKSKGYSAKIFLHTKLKLVDQDRICNRRSARNFIDHKGVERNMVYREQSENSSTESGTDTDLSPGLSFGLSGDDSIISGHSLKTEALSYVSNEKKILQKNKVKNLTKRRKTREKLLFKKITTKGTRAILIGWKHAGCRMHFNRGGSQSIIVPNEFTYEQLLQSVCDVYFPNGENPDRQLQLKDFDTHMAHYTGRDLVPEKGRSFTVHEFWKCHKDRTRIFLHTELKPVDQDRNWNCGSTRIRQKIAINHIGVERNMVNREHGESSSTDSGTDTSEEDTLGLSGGFCGNDPIIIEYMGRRDSVVRRLNNLIPQEEIIARMSKDYGQSDINERTLA